MKYSRPLITGSILTVVAVLLVVIGKFGPAAKQDRTANPAAAAPRTAPSAATPQESKYARPQRTREASESPDAKALKLLWARGRGQELLVALDQLSQHAAADDWREVADVLVDQAAQDGRHEIAAYLLAASHGAPNSIRLTIHAAALENPDTDIQATAKLELLNLTGQEFDSREQATAWIAAHPEASRDDDEDAQ